MQKYKSNLTSVSGAAVRGASVTVLDESGAVASIFLDRAGALPAGNPLKTGQDGTFEFYAANGRYSLRTDSSGLNVLEEDVIMMFDPEDGAESGPIADAAAALGDLETSGNLTPTAEWSEVPSVVNRALGATDPLNEQALANANRTALLRDNQKRTPMIFAALSEAQAAAATLPDGQRVEIEADETRGGRSTRYVVQSGALVFVQYGVRDDLADPTKGANLVATSDGRTVETRLAAIPNEVDAAGTATVKVAEHNADAAAHPALSAFITSEANRAEAAKDAALIQAGVYVDEPTGRAAVADGQAFKVQGSGNVAAYEYRRVNASTVSTLIATYPSIAALNGKAFDLIFTRKGFVNQQGAFVTNDAWGATDYLPLDLLVVGAFSLYGHTNTNSVAFFDAQKRFISGSRAGTIGQAMTTYPAPPENASYVTFSFYRPAQIDQSFSYAISPEKAANRGIQDAMRNGSLMENLAPIATLTGYVGTSGAVANTTDTNFLRSDYIACDSGMVLDCRLFGHTAVNCVSFYDSSKTYISGLAAPANNAPFTQMVTSPVNTAFVRLSFANPLVLPAAAGTTPFVGRVKNVVTGLKAVESSIADIQANQAENSISSYAQNFAGNAVTAGYIGLAGQNVGTDANWLRSDYIPLAAGEVITPNMVGHTIVNCISFYDANKIYLSGVAAGSAALPGAIVNAPATAPAGAAYFRISFGNPATYPIAQQSGITPSAKITRNLGQMVSDNKLQSAKNTEALKFRATLEQKSMRKLLLTATSKVILYGDSISSTDYAWYKNAMQTLTGAQVYNGGYSGQNAAATAADSKLQRIFDYQPNLIVVLLGGNDSGAANSVGTFSGFVEGEPIVPETNIGADYAGTYFIQAVSHTMRKVKNYYYNIRARAGLTGSETEAEKGVKIDAVLKPVIVFCSSLPQKRNNSSDAFSQVSNWKRKRDAIAECCVKYGVQFVDLQMSCSFDMSIEPYWVSPTDKLTNNGVYFMDGLHPNKYGYQIIAETVCAEIGL